MNIRTCIQLIGFTFLFLGSVSGQSLYTIKVVNNLSEKAIGGAEIIYKDSVSTKTNRFGYFQVQANLADTLIITHQEFKDLAILLPEATKFQVALQLKNDFLEYSNGLASFYRELQKKIKFPDLALSQGIQANIYVELMIDSLGRADIHISQYPNEELFVSEIQKAFDGLQGNWNKDYVGKVLILPILFRISSMQPLKIEERYIPNANILMSEIIVTSYK